MKKIIWSWSDGDGTYVNQAESLEEIIEEIVEYYYDGDAEVNVKRCDGYFEVNILDKARGLVNLYEPLDSKVAVVEFLAYLAKQEGRPDIFCIQEVL